MNNGVQHRRLRAGNRNSICGAAALLEDAIDASDVLAEPVVVATQVAKILEPDRRLRFGER